ncbi:MAG: AAA family ATPase [Microcoleaceae cyanobacterium]
MSFNPALCRNEREVESKLIVSYLLPQLGYTPETWHQEVTFGNIRLDFLSFAAQTIPFTLNADSPSGVVIEAKHPNQNLNRHVYKLRRYLTSLSVRYGLLTNGKEIRIYERVAENIKLVFQCQGEEIEAKIKTIRDLIGREFIQPRYHPTALLVPSPTCSVDPNPVQTIQPFQNTTINHLNNQKAVSSAYPQTTLTKNQNKMKVIAVYHNKGGVGKTTTVVNLAAAFSKKGYRVLVIDLDSQANTTFATGLVKFQFDEDDNIKDAYVYHLLKSGELDFIPDLARKSDGFNDPEIDVIPSHINLLEYQDILKNIQATPFRLPSKLKQAEDNYDIVIIDTPPSRDLYAQLPLIAADYLIIPSDLKPFANQGLSNVKNMIKDVNEVRNSTGRNPINILGVLPSKVSTNSRYIKYVLERQKKVITEKYDFPLMNSTIFERTALSQCLNETIIVGELEIAEPQSIFKYADKNANAGQSVEEFEALATEVLSKMES